MNESWRTEYRRRRWLSMRRHAGEQANRKVLKTDVLRAFAGWQRQGRSPWRWSYAQESRRRQAALDDATHSVGRLSVRPDAAKVLKTSPSDGWQRQAKPVELADGVRSHPGAIGKRTLPLPPVGAVESRLRVALLWPAPKPGRFGQFVVKRPLSPADGSFVKRQPL